MVLNPVYTTEYSLTDAPSKETFKWPNPVEEKPAMDKLVAVSLERDEYTTAAGSRELDTFWDEMEDSATDNEDEGA
jgi:hypothetical protein